MKTMPIRDMLYEEPGPKTRRTITIVTILAVLLLLALLVVAVVWKVSGSRAPGDVATQDDLIRADQVVSVRFDVLVSGASSEYMEAFERYAVGSSIVRDNNLVDGKITDMRAKPCTSVLSPAGDVLSVSGTDRYDVVFTVEYTGKMNTNCLMEGRQPLRVGADYLLRTLFLEVNGHITDVEILDK